MSKTEQQVTEQKAASDEKVNVVSETEAAFEEMNEEVASETLEQKTQGKLPAMWVYRRQYVNKADGKTYWEYVLPALYCGQVAEVGLKVQGEKDVEGYRMLERLFNGGVKKVPFHAVEETRYNSYTNKSEKKWVYSVGIEVDGFEWTYPVTTRRGSDRAILENYIRYLVFKSEREAKA